MARRYHCRSGNLAAGAVGAPAGACLRFRSPARRHHRARAAVRDRCRCWRRLARRSCLPLLAILLALVALVAIWFDGRKGTRNAFVAIFVSLLLLAYPGYLGVRAYRLPQIYDVTTDPYDPPRFEAVARLRTREANPVAYAGLATYQQQRAAYPDIEPLIAAATPQAAYDAALARRHQAQVAHRRCARAAGRPPRWPHRSDRAKPDHGISRRRRDPHPRRRAPVRAIDVRSASRYGWHDFGTNAARVAQLDRRHRRRGNAGQDRAASKENRRRPRRRPTGKDAQPARR